MKDRKGVAYCNDVITVDPEDDLRRVGPVARVSKEFRETMAKRTSVERVNSRLKEARRLNDHCFRGIEKVTTHCLLSVLTMQAVAVAQARAGELGTIRQCLRKVA